MTILFLVVVVSAIWVAVDASSIRARKQLARGPGGYEPTAWALIVLGLWIVGFPIYLVRRGEALAGPDGGGPEQTTTQRNPVFFAVGIFLWILGPLFVLGGMAAQKGGAMTIILGLLMISGGILAVRKPRPVAEPYRGGAATTSTNPPYPKPHN